MPSTIVPTPDVAAIGPRTVYLNFEGASLSRSQFADDATTGESAIVVQNLSIGAFDANSLRSTEGLTRSQIISRVVSGMQQLHAAYNITFTTSRPSSGNYQMIVFGGNCAGVAGTNCAGIALRDCGDQMPNNITFVFPGGLRVDDLITTAAQENAHAYGLGHTDDTTDVMYPAITNAIPFRYGEGNIPDNSGCNTSYQDSHQLMLDTIGAPGTDSNGPTITVTNPQTDGVLFPGDVISGSAADSSGIASVEIAIGQWSTNASANFDVIVPSGLATGQITLWIFATDNDGNRTTKSIPITMASGNEDTCSKASDCSAGLKCKSNLCVPDDGLNELGDTCSNAQECTTGICQLLVEDSFCSQTCSAEVACPDGFGCRSNGFCFKSTNSGCSSSSSTPLLMLFITMVLLGRRKLS